MVNEPNTELKAALAELVAEGRRDLGPHPTVDELAAYGTGELPEAAETRVRDHVVLCRHCLELVLDRGRLSDPELGSEGALPPEAVAADWRSLQTRLAGEAAPPGVSHRPLRSSRGGLRRFFASPRPAYALAAAVLVAAVGLALRNRQLERGIEELRRPQLNAPVVDLFPASPLRGGEEETAIVAPAPASRFFTLILSPKGSPDFADYRAEILDPRGRVLWSAKGLEKGGDGSFTLILSRGFLRPGEYRIRLYGLQGGTGRKLEEFRLRVVP